MSLMWARSCTGERHRRRPCPPLPDLRRDARHRLPLIQGPRTQPSSRSIWARRSGATSGANQRSRSSEASASLSCRTTALTWAASRIMPIGTSGSKAVGQISAMTTPRPHVHPGMSASQPLQDGDERERLAPDAADAQQLPAARRGASGGTQRLLTGPELLHTNRCDLGGGEVFRGTRRRRPPERTRT